MILPVILYCAVYLPPPICVSRLDYFIEQCNNVFDATNIPVCIIGDFNLARIEWQISTDNNTLPNTCERLLDFMNMNKLNQHNNIKNSSGRTLDLVLSTVNSCSVSLLAP